MINRFFSGVGKSALIKRHCEHRFFSRYVMTIGIDYGVVKFGFRECIAVEYTFVSIFQPK